MEEYWLPEGTYLEKDKYRIERVIGDGGFGITYLGYDEKLRRKVAIKEFYMRGYCYRRPDDERVYPCDGQKGNAFENEKLSFIEEGRVLAALNEQPGVVNIYNFIEENNTAYLIMDYVDGKSLEVYIKECGGRLSVPQTLLIMKPVIRALIDIHKRGIIHRDISPDNIMITNDRKVKLIDFGAAKQYGSYNENKVRKGGYSPLEQVVAHGQVGPYSDIYAICATIYTCITGVRVMPALERTNDDRLAAPSKLGVIIEPEADETLMQGLALYSEQRIPDAESLYGRLYGSLEHKSEQHKTNTAITKMISDIQREQKKKLRLTIAVGIVCVFAIVAGACIYLRKNGDSKAVSEATHGDDNSYAQELYDLCAGLHNDNGIPLVWNEELAEAAEYAANQAALLSYANANELNEKLSEIGSSTLEVYGLSDTGWVIYTFQTRAEVRDVKQALDEYIREINMRQNGSVNLDNCSSLGVGVSHTEDGIYYWAVFYQR